ncbi:KUP/HAK/KT family potassium transporter [Bradyrhizobium sp.]|uniref:KUP/HAK/KT family potassium transporter n=1 Tax=Bradyrhizobium sp. TaxID=376 RepID=UPI002D437641|nr:hypothetical protein [Bradyrhizobium sp.]HZR73825.1 hypothetical protein [Bradyrhizobium sp.]
MSFFASRVKLVPAKDSALGRLRSRIFELTHRNALAATDLFRIPPNRLIELGIQTEICERKNRLDRRESRQVANQPAGFYPWDENVL